MNEVEHTAGPWYANDDAVYKDYGDKRYPVAIACDSGEIVANARLIAAAPDLLAACRAAAKATEDDGDPANLPNGVLNALHAAINKAEGGAA